MVANTITSAQAGTALVTGAGSIQGMTVTMPIPNNVDTKTPLTLIDAAAANPTAKVLYSAFIGDLAAFLFGSKPASVPITPGGPTAPPAGTLMSATPTIPFTQGLYVRSCPANATFTATT